MHFCLLEDLNIRLGPFEWSKRRFEDAIQEDFDILFPLPFQNSEAIDIHNSLKIRPVKETIYPNMNGRIQELAGPFVTITDTDCTLTYNAADKSIDSIKNELKSEVANNRYNFEVGGTTVTIQDQELPIITSRGERDIYLQTLQLGGDNITWKFNDKWVVLSLAELQTIVTAVFTHVKNSFEWEAAKVTEIDACTTLDQLAAIEAHKV